MDDCSTAMAEAGNGALLTRDFGVLWGPKSPKPEVGTWGGSTSQTYAGLVQVPNLGSRRRLSCRRASGAIGAMVLLSVKKDAPHPYCELARDILRESSARASDEDSHQYSPCMPQHCLESNTWHHSFRAYAYTHTYIYYTHVCT